MTILREGFDDMIDRTIDLVGRARDEEPLVDASIDRSRRLGLALGTLATALSEPPTRPLEPWTPELVKLISPASA